MAALVQAVPIRSTQLYEIKSAGQRSKRRVYIILDRKLDQRLEVFRPDRDILQFRRGCSPAVAWGDIYRFDKERG